MVLKDMYFIKSYKNLISTKNLSDIITICFLNFN